MVIDSQTIQDNSFALAIEVIRDRIRRLPEDDARDLHELLPSLFSCDEEERQSAAKAIQEILAAQVSPAGTIKAFEAAAGLEPLRKWVDHASGRIKELRKQHGLTQAELAAKADIPQSYISRLENGEHSPTAKTIQRIADALGVPATDIDPSAG